MNHQLQTCIQHARDAAGNAWAARECGDNPALYEHEARFWIARARRLVDTLSKPRSNVYRMEDYRK